MRSVQLHLHSPVFPEKQEGTGGCWQTVLKSLVPGFVTGRENILHTVIRIRLGQYAIAYGFVTITDMLNASLL